MGLLWRVIKWVMFSAMILGNFKGLDYISTTSKVWPLFPMLLALGMMMILFKSVFDDSKSLMVVSAFGMLLVGGVLNYGLVLVEPYLVPYSDVVDVYKAYVFDDFYGNWLVWHLIVITPIVGFMMSRD